jgi:hypothetical protein
LAKKPWLSSKHPAKALARLLGEWSVEVVIPGADKPFRGHASFRWLAKDALMVFRCRAGGGVPKSISVLGADDVNGTYSLQYSDDRGVTRQYAMELTRTELRFERRAPRFSQRFIGKFEKNGRVIRGEWQKSTDGRTWEHDLDFVYTKK